MDRLNEIRDEINKIDEKILCELEKRSNLTDEIGEIKAETFAPVFVPERETEVILGLEAGATESLKGIVAPLFKTVMRLSRRNQYARIYNKLKESAFSEELSGAVSKVSEIDKGKKPCLEVVFRNHDEVNNFFNVVNDYGFYPLEFSLKDRTGLVCRSVIDMIDKKNNSEEMLIKAMYQLCNEFESVHLVGWIGESST